MQNKCNVGYAFINMISPVHIISFYQVIFFLGLCPLFAIVTCRVKNLFPAQLS
jgi:hypothetical protein